MENNKLQVRPIQESDWNFLPNWWKEYPNWRGYSIPREMLPGRFQVKVPTDMTEEDHKSLGNAGFIVSKGRTPVAAVWLYMMNSKLCTIAPVVSDKGYKDTDKKEALQLLLHFTTQFAKDMGYEYCHAFSTHEGLTKIYEDVGYQGEPCQELTIKL